MPSSLRLGVVVLLPCPVIAAVVIACSDAPQSIIGGAPQFDGQPDPLVVNDACASPKVEPNATWTLLYADIFGPTGLGNCGAPSRGGSATCHHDPGGNGAQSSNFICGDTQASCYQGLTGDGGENYFGVPLVVPNAPCSSGLTQVLRHDGGGVMPFDPNTVVFSDTDMARVASWIAQGAQNN